MRSAKVAKVVSSKKETDCKGEDVPVMPFDDALRKILSAPPKHRVAKKKVKTKKPGE